MALLLVLTGAYAVWITQAGFTVFAKHEILGNDRVRADFGNDVRISFMVGWSLGGEATLLAYLRGSEADGFATARLMEAGGKWHIVRAEVLNKSEEHTINLSPPPPLAAADQLKGEGRLYIVAIGDSASNEVIDLANFTRTKLNAPVEVLPTMPVPLPGFDPRRRQWIAEMLVDSIAQQFPAIAADQDAKIIGLIDQDLYPRSLGWPFAYNYRQAGKYAVVPSVRVDPGFYGHRPRADIRMDRLQKIVAKLVGMYYFGFQETYNPDSVMLGDHTPEDMDRMSGMYLASDLQTQLNRAKFAGKPMLSFSSVNVAGLPRLKPIDVYWEPYDISESSYYQIDLSSGEFRVERNDLYRSGPLPLFMRRMHFSHAYDGKIRAFGPSTWHNLDDTVWSTDPQSIQTISIHGVEYQRINGGVGFSPTARYRAPGNSGEFSNALLSWDNGQWKIETSGYEVWRYLGCSPNSPVPCYFMNRTSRDGDRVGVERDQNGRIKTVNQRKNTNLLTAADDHTWTVTYDGDTIRNIADSDGGSGRYTYDAAAYLTDVEADGHKLHYDYDSSHRMNRIVEDGHQLQVHYDTEGRVNEVDFEGRPAYRIKYSGETVEVTDSTGIYVIKLRTTYFQLDHQTSK